MCIRDSNNLVNLAKRLEIDEDKIIQLIEALKKDGIVKASKNKYIEINSN